MHDRDERSSRREMLSSPIFNSATRTLFSKELRALKVLTNVLLSIPNTFAGPEVHSLS